jgi:hypothetical protein
MKKIILSVALMIMINSAEASTTICSAEIYSDDIKQYTYSQITGTFSFTVNNTYNYDQTFDIEETVCITNTVCTKKGYTRIVKKYETMPFTDTLVLSKNIDFASAGTKLEIESTINVKPQSGSGSCYQKAISYVHIVP